MVEASAINEMFAGIAGRYDLANHLLSAGQDFYWRKKLAQEVLRSQPRRVVDLATGSGDCVFSIAKALNGSAHVTGMDFCPPMLEQAERKKKALLEKKPKWTTCLREVDFIQGDCLELPFSDGEVDVLTIAFGLRNLEDRARGLREMRRVLRKPGGVLLVLEFSQPDTWVRPFYYLYLNYLIPVIARLATGKPDAYRYLGATIGKFPPKDALEKEFLEAGFDQVTSQGLSFSIVAIHRAEVLGS